MPFGLGGLQNFLSKNLLGVAALVPGLEPGGFGSGACFEINFARLFPCHPFGILAFPRCFLGSLDGHGITGRFSPRGIPPWKIAGLGGARCFSLRDFLFHRGSLVSTCFLAVPRFAGGRGLEQGSGPSPVPFGGFGVFPWNGRLELRSEE